MVRRMGKYAMKIDCPIPSYVLDNLKILAIDTEGSIYAYDIPKARKILERVWKDVCKDND